MIKIDWRYMARAVIILVLTVIVAVMISVAGDQYQAAQQEKYAQSLSRLRFTHRLYNNLVKDIDLIEQYRTLFNGYQSSGLVGKERRLSWIESLKATNKVIKLPNFTYRLLPQEKFERPGLPVKRGVEVNSAAMQLNMGLLHEEDIFSVFDGLRLSIESLFAVDSCILIRNAKLGQPLDTQKANLSANCVIRWVTIDAS
jgi:hypothetical protein